MVEYVVCFSCGCILFNLEEVLYKVCNVIFYFMGLDIVVMGCIVNGFGEMVDVDYGYVGKILGVILFYCGCDEICKVFEVEGVEVLI